VGSSEAGNHDGKQREPLSIDPDTLSIVRQMIAEQKTQNEIIMACFPGMRNADAIVEYRKTLAYLIGGM
jgi:hypothetical protein